MPVRTRPARRVMRAAAVSLAPLVATLLAPAVAAASASPSPTAADQPLVNWTWLGLGLGGMLFMLVIMFALTRYFAAKQRRQ